MLFSMYNTEIISVLFSGLIIANALNGIVSSIVIKGASRRKGVLKHRRLRLALLRSEVQKKKTYNKANKTHKIKYV